MKLMIMIPHSGNSGSGYNNKRSKHPDTHHQCARTKWNPGCNFVIHNGSKHITSWYCSERIHRRQCVAKLISTCMTLHDDETKQKDFKALLKTDHTNLVRYFGMRKAPGHLILFMELISENLTAILKCSADPLPYHIQVDLCHDIAKGVAHLHSLGVIHKHLSSNNVLITEDGTAKVTDYAISYMMGSDELFRKDSMKVYMPPQFYEEVQQYTEKWDTFSIGVLTIQICTRQYPNPGRRTRPIVDNRFPSGIANCEELETLRRKNHLDLINQTNPLRKIIAQSIQNEEELRETVQKVSSQLEALKQTYKYAESVGEVANNKSLRLKRVGTRRDQDYRITRGSTTRKGTTVYMRTGVSMCSYDFTTQEWKSLTDCPQRYSSLAIVKGYLTAIGGEDGEVKNEITNQLICLIDGRWQRGKFEPMPTKRSYTMSICTEDKLVVAGGATRSKTAVQLIETMDLNTLAWTRMKAVLPLPLSRASVTMCDDKMYMLGGQDDKGRTKTAIACKLSDLKADKLDSWHVITDTPAYESTCAIVQGRLIAVGGSTDRDSKLKSDLVYLYDPYNDSWAIVQDIQLFHAGRSECHVAVLPGAFEDVLMVGGGDVTWRSPSDVAERYIVRNWASDNTTNIL